MNWLNFEYVQLAISCLLGVNLRVITNYLFEKFDIAVVDINFLSNVVGCITIATMYNLTRFGATEQWVKSLKTGLSGSYTTFSGFAFALGTSHKNDLGDSIVVGTLQVSFFVVLVRFFNSLHERQISDIEEPQTSAKTENTSNINASPFYLLLFTLLIVLNVFGFFIVSEKFYFIIFLILAIFGCFLRKVMGKLNQKNWKYGTFAANILGSIIYACVVKYIDSKTWITIWTGAFCGCLTTVSSFINEAVTIPQWYGVWYITLTIVIGSTVTVLLQ
ncbi:hypothetical protein PCE1_003465 [Barthelona sp. PCE]